MLCIWGIAAATYLLSYLGLALVATSFGNSLKKVVEKLADAKIWVMVLANMQCIDASNSQHTHLNRIQSEKWCVERMSLSQSRKVMTWKAVYLRCNSEESLTRLLAALTIMNLSMNAPYRKFSILSLFVQPTECQLVLTDMYCKLLVVIEIIAKSGSLQTFLIAETVNYELSVL